VIAGIGGTLLAAQRPAALWTVDIAICSEFFVAGQAEGRRAGRRASQQRSFLEQKFTGTNIAAGREISSQFIGMAFNHIGTFAERFVTWPMLELVFSTAVKNFLAASATLVCCYIAHRTAVHT